MIKGIDKLIQEKGMLKHPFYRAWNMGKLSLHSLREYAKQYYKLEAAFPTFLSAIHSHCNDRSVRQMLLENMIDEEMGTENHAELWLRFCEGLGISREDVLNADELPETRKAIDNFRKLSSIGHFAFGVAAMYAYESQIPEVAKTKREGLNKFYGIKNERAIKFFKVHEKADVWHSEVERRILNKFAKDSKLRNGILASTKKARNSLWLFLDGVYKTYC